MKYKYGELFERLGIPGMGHLGATWCAYNPDSVLVLMAHQNYFYWDKITKKFRYEVPRDEPLPPRALSATRSLEMISQYFAEDRKIILAVAVFSNDGGIRPDGTWESSTFEYATGDYYIGRMKQFNRTTGHLLCDLDEKRSV